MDLCWIAGQIKSIDTKTKETKQSQEEMILCPCQSIVTCINQFIKLKRNKEWTRQTSKLKEIETNTKSGKETITSKKNLTSINRFGAGPTLLNRMQCFHVTSHNDCVTSFSKLRRTL